MFYIMTSVVLYFVFVYFSAIKYDIWWNQILVQLGLYILFVILIIFSALTAATENPGFTDIVSAGLVTYTFIGFLTVVFAPIGTLFIVIATRRREKKLERGNI